MRLVRKQMEWALEEIRQANAVDDDSLRAQFAKEYGEPLAEDWDALEKECDRLTAEGRRFESERNELQDRLNKLAAEPRAEPA